MGILAVALAVVWAISAFVLYYLRAARKRDAADGIPIGFVWGVMFAIIFFILAGKLGS